jgi:RNA polymerase sigma-70 factor (ECF subfamily)
MGQWADEIDPTGLLARARDGGAADISQLLDHYRPYLAMLARLGASRRLQGKYDDSDLVQETLLLVQRDLPGFRGTTEAELLAWLRCIMASVSAKHIRHFSRRRRDASVECQIEDELNQSSQAVERVLIAPDTSPSERSVKRERAVILSRALTQLPPDYREALIMHRLEGLTMAETAARMGRSVDSIQKLLARGLVELRRRLQQYI